MLANLVTKGLAMLQIDPANRTRGFIHEPVPKDFPLVGSFSVHGAGDNTGHSRDGCTGRSRCGTDPDRGTGHTSALLLIELVLLGLHLGGVKCNPIHGRIVRLLKTIVGTGLAEFGLGEVGAPEAEGPLGKLLSSISDTAQ